MRDEISIFQDHIHPLTPISTGETPTGFARISQVKAMIFDVYGTLLISASGENNPHNRHDSPKRKLTGVLQRYGIDHTPESLMNDLHRTIEHTHANLRQEGIDYPEVDMVHVWETILGVRDINWLKTFALEYEMVVNPVYPMPGLEELLAVCRERNLLLGIISNAQFFTPLLLQHMLGMSLDMSGFDPQLIFYSYRFRTAKPSLLMFDRAAAALRRRGVSPASVLYVGNDMRNDILPAKKVGFQTVLFAGDRRSLKRRNGDVSCKHITPDAIVTHLRQLIAAPGPLS